MSSETNSKFDIYQTYRKILQDEEVRHYLCTLLKEDLYSSSGKDVSPACSDLVAL